MQSFDSYRESTATTSVDTGRLQPGWTVFDALDRPVGNVTDLEGGELRIDGRPEGLGFYSVPADTIREVRDGSVHLTIDSDIWRSEGQASGAMHGGGIERDAEAAFQDTAPGERPSSGTMSAAQTGPERPTESRPPRHEQIHGSSYTASNTPVGQGSNTPVGDEPDTFRTWDRNLEHSSWSKLGPMAIPTGIGAASAAAYVWWRKRQTRRNRLARLTRGLASASGSLAPLLDAARGGTSPVLHAARERGGAWWLASLLALPLAHYLRSAAEKGTVEELMDEVRPRRGWRSRLPATPSAPSMPSLASSRALMSGPAALADAVEPPPLWMAIVPVAAAGLVAAWLGTRTRRQAHRSGGTRRLREIMTPNVEVIGPEATIFEAATTMRRLGVGFLPVCDGRRLQGVLTDRDIVVRPIADSRDPQVTTAQHAMSTEVIYAFDDDTVERGAELMKRHQIRRLPIVDRGKNLIGVVSLGDLAVEAGRDQLSGDTLERISEPARPRR